MDSSTHTSAAFKRGSILLFFVLTGAFAILYILNEPLYRAIISEDHLVEWLTFAALFSAGMVSLWVAWQIKLRYHYLHWFFILFLGFNLLAGFEEVSWGQRVFGFSSNEFFQEYNDQKETNLHNTFQGILQIKTKHLALLVLFIYGVIMPWLKQRNKLPQYLVERYQFIIPPVFLRIPFLLGTVLMLDFQTGYEEEIGELYYSLCFLILMLWNGRLLKHTPAFAPRGITVPFRPAPLLSAHSKKVS
ncbi:MAG TPA: hypothetical protein VGE26_04175 [Sphingobacteriaceae bacterium]